MPKPGEPKRTSSLEEEVRGDWRRSRTQTASRREVLPWALSPVKRVMGPSKGQESAWKQRKSRRRREVSMAAGRESGWSGKGAASTAEARGLAGKRRGLQGRLGRIDWATMIAFKTLLLTGSLLLAGLPFSLGAAEAEGRAVQSGAVEYREGSVALQGWVARPEGLSQAVPGVLVVHDWTGVQASAKERAEQLARLGYVALVADIYGKGVRPSNPKESGAEAGKYKGDRALYRARLRAGLEELQRQPNVDGGKLAAIGYCFGGTGVLELARAGAAVRGVVSFHGGLDSPTPADGKNIKAKVLVLHGADDPYVPAEGIAAMIAEFKGAKVDWQMVSYSGAVHSFTNPAAGHDNSKGAAYNAVADARSWTAMRAFFDELFAPAAK